MNIGIQLGKEYLRLVKVGIGILKEGILNIANRNILNIEEK